MITESVTHVGSTKIYHRSLNHPSVLSKMMQAKIERKTRVEVTTWDIFTLESHFNVTEVKDDIWLNCIISTFL